MLQLSCPHVTMLIMRLSSFSFLNWERFLRNDKLKFRLSEETCNKFNLSIYFLNTFKKRFSNISCCWSSHKYWSQIMGADSVSYLTQKRTIKSIWPFCEEVLIDSSNTVLCTKKNWRLFSARVHEHRGLVQCEQYSWLLCDCIEMILRYSCLETW